MSVRGGFGAVADHFNRESGYWDAAYHRTDVGSLIYQQRQALALRWVDDLQLAAGSRALDVGTGAGRAAIALAARGLRVEAVDGARAMAGLAERNAYAAGFGEHVHATTGDAQALSFVDNAFDLVLALGVLPWVQRPGDVWAEMARVLRPGGHLVASTANRDRLTFRLDPLHSQDLLFVKRPIRHVLERAGWWSSAAPEPDLQPVAHSDRLLASVGLQRLAGTTLGFGPFTALGLRVLPHEVEVGLHRRLQHMADRGVRGVRGWGVDYVVLARKQP